MRRRRCTKMPLLEITLKSELAKLYTALKNRPEQIVNTLKRRLDITMTMLASYIVREKLSGQILKRRTGILAGSVHPVLATIQGTQIKAGVRSSEGPALYGRYLEEGSRAHQIFSVRARALSFVMDGKQRFFQRVSHPGIAAKPFMGSALAENESNIREALQQALDAGN
jgi:hypothetical protein